MATTTKRANEFKRAAMKDRNANGKKNLGGVTSAGDQKAAVKKIINDNIK